MSIVHIDNVPGLYYYPNYLTESEHTSLLEEVKLSFFLPFRGDGTRRVCQYGYEYNYSNRKTKPTTPIPQPLINALSNLNEELLEAKIFDKPFVPQQLIINEYKECQRIGQHTDADVFGPIIIGISLSASTHITFKKSGINPKTSVLKLNPGDLIIMTGDSRYKFTHQTRPTRKNQIRYSITYRTIA